MKLIGESFRGLIPKAWDLDRYMVKLRVKFETGDDLYLVSKIVIRAR